MNTLLNVFIAPISAPLNGGWYDLLTEDGRTAAKLAEFDIAADGKEAFISDYEAAFKIDMYESLEALNDLGEMMEDMDDMERYALSKHIENNNNDIEAGIYDFENGCNLFYDGTEDEDEAIGRCLIDNEIYPRGFDPDSDAALYFDYDAYGYAKKSMEWSAFKVEDNDGYHIGWIVWSC